MIRYLLAFIAFMGVWLIGGYVLGIHPTAAEGLLVVAACAVSDLVIRRSS